MIKWNELVAKHRQEVEHEVYQAMKRTNDFGAVGWVVDVILYADGTPDHVVKANKYDNVTAVYNGEACHVCTVECYDLYDWYNMAPEELEKEDAHELRVQYFDSARVEIEEEIEQLVDAGIERLIDEQEQERQDREFQERLEKFYE